MAKARPITADQRKKLLAAIGASPTYRKAYEDLDFLRREELRPIRLQLELLKTEMTLVEQNIQSTIVVFGSARLPSPEDASAALRAAERELAKRPKDGALRLKLQGAKNLIARSRYYDEARKFGAIVTKASHADQKREFVIVTGGGPGIMEAANRGAYEADGTSIGLNITLPHEQDSNPYITPELCFQFHYFAVRKMHFMMRCKAMIAFPGGFGTMDELFEALTLVQTGKKRRLPVILFGREFWRKVVNFEYLCEQGMISPEDLKLYQHVETAEEAWRTIQQYWNRNGLND